MQVITCGMTVPECENKVTDESGSELSLFTMALSENLMCLSHFLLCPSLPWGHKLWVSVMEIWT